MMTRCSGTTPLQVAVLCGTVAVAIPGFAGCRSTQESAPPPAARAPTAQPAAPTGPLATADDLLKSLETADENLRTLTAEIDYVKTFATAGDRQVRRGKLYFQGFTEAEKDTPTKGRKFAIHFLTLMVGTRISDDPQIYIFDGQWLLEKRPNEKRFSKRVVVPPGQRFDPLKIGEGPLPIPIGQRREDILSRYDALLLPPEEGLDPAADKDLLPFVKGCYQLKLVPKPERKREDKFSEIRLWYRADPAAGGRLLPRMAKTLSATEPGDEGDESLIRLINVQINTDLPKDAIDTNTPTGWDGQVLEFREPK